MKIVAVLVAADDQAKTANTHLLYNAVLSVVVMAVFAGCGRSAGTTSSLLCSPRRLSIDSVVMTDLQRTSVPMYASKM